MTLRSEVRHIESRIDSTRERETTVLTTLRPMPTSTATIDVADLVREVLARLPDMTADLVSPAIDLPTAVLLQRAPEARRRLADEAPDKDDDTEEEEDEDDADDDADEDDDDDWDADDDDDDDDWDEDDDEDEDDEDDDEDDDDDWDEDEDDD